MSAKKDRQPAPRECLHCGTNFDASLDYQGNARASTRRYCTTECRRLARNAHSRALRAWKVQNEALAALHETERHGQLSLDERPLPILTPRPVRGAV